MPGAKRTSKSVSYTEHDDDDDFVNTKKARNTKTNDRQTEPKSTTRPAPRKRNEKLSKAEQEEIDLALQLSKATVPTNEISIEISTISDDKESTTSQSTVSSHENEITVENDNDEQDENFLPKNKRMKREEEEEDDDDDEEESNSEEEEEEQEPTPKKKPIRKTEETKKKNTEITPIDLESTRSITRDQQKSSIPTSESSKKKSNVPIGFPTSKIIIPSLQTSRVGLSRKSSAIKSLHPNLNQRTVHE